MANRLLELIETIPLRGSRIQNEYTSRVQTSRYEQYNRPSSIDDCDCTGDGDCVCVDCNECGND